MGRFGCLSLATAGGREVKRMNLQASLLDEIVRIEKQEREKLPYINGAGEPLPWEIEVDDIEKNDTMSITDRKPKSVAASRTRGSGAAFFVKKNIKPNNGIRHEVRHNKCSITLPIFTKAMTQNADIMYQSFLKWAKQAEGDSKLKDEKLLQEYFLFFLE